MVTRVLRAVYREIRGLHEAAYLLAVFALGSQLLALVRDRLIAHEFGAGNELDIYYAAFRVPDVLFVVFASALSVYVLIPFVSERLLESVSNARALISSVFTWFLLGYAVVALVIIVFAGDIATHLYPGFTEENRTLLVAIMRILLIQPFLLGFSSLLGVVTQLHRKFILYALSPLLYNIGIIVGIVAFYPLFGLVGLAYGVVLGAVLHAGVQIPFVRHSGLFPLFVLRTDVHLLWRILRSSLPRACTLMLHQFVMLALTSVATFMTVGSIAVLQLSYNLQSVPLSVIGVSYSVAAFPTLSMLFSKGERTAFLRHVYTALRHILFWSIPALALIVVIRAQLVRVILGTGAFNWDDTRLTAAALALFAVSLAAQAVHLLIVRAFYAGGDTRTPLIVTALSSVGIVGLSGAFFWFYGQSAVFGESLAALFRVSDIAGVEVLLLPLAFSTVFVLHSSVLTYLFVREYGTRVQSGIGGVLVRALGCGFVTAAVAYTTLNLLVDGFRVDTFIGIFLQGLIAGVLGIAAGFVFLWSARSPELAEVLASLKKRIFSVRPITPQDTPT